MSTRPKQPRIKHQKRCTIGYLTTKTAGGIDFPRWIGVADAARQQNANLISFAGRRYREIKHFNEQANILYDLIDSDVLNGVIDGSIFYEHVISEEDIRAFYQKLPGQVVCIRQTVPGIPHIPLDNYEGMKEALVHLIEVHQYRRIAFLCGPSGHPYAEERYRAYTDILQKYQIPFDPNLVAPPSAWDVSSIEVLLDKRKLQPGHDFEAVVAASDTMKAISALKILQSRGFRVPQDVAVVGFDNTADGRAQIPPLTSVRIPFYEQGQQATRLLFALMAGEDIHESLSLPAQLVVRQSCGCIGSAVIQAAAGPLLPSGESYKTALRARETEILETMTQPFEQTPNLLPQIRSVFEGFFSEMQGGIPGTFVATLNEVLSQIIGTTGEVAEWQKALSALRRAVLPYLTDRTDILQAENLWGQARVVIGESLQQSYEIQKFQASQQAERLRLLERKMMMTFDLEGLMDVLAQGLPLIGIPTCYLALYDDPPAYAVPQQTPERARLLLAYTEQGRIPLEHGGLLFPARQLVPPEFLPQERPYHLLMESLYFRDNQFGFILFEVGPRDGDLYEMLQLQISSALQGALLVQRMQERSAEIARQKYVLDTFMADVPDNIYFKDRDSHFTQVSAALARCFNAENPQELLGKSDFDFFPADQAQAKYEAEQKVMQTGQPIFAIEEPEAGGRWSLTTKMPLRDEHGAIIGTFGISRDITALKQAQLEVAAAYEEIQHLNTQLKTENLRMSAELEISRRIQQMVLPAQKELQQIEGVEIVGYMQPANEVGGDYYDVLQSHGLVHIGIGDVTGHGLESGVLMLMTQTAIRTLIEHGETNPVAFFSTLNRVLLKNTQRIQADKTLTLALLKYACGTLKIVGQHEELVVVRQGGRVECVDTIDLGFPLGLEEEISEFIAEASLVLHSGESVILYTDGVTEAQNSQKQFYGLERLCACVSQHWELSAEAIKQAIVNDLMAFIGSQKVDDDLTLVVLKQQ